MGDNNRFVAFLRRLSEIALIGALGFALLLDLVLTTSRAADPPVLLVLVSGAVGIAAVLLRNRVRVGGMTTFLLVSLFVTIVVGALPGDGGYPGFAEMSAVVVLTIGALRWVQPFFLAAVLAVASMIALEATTARFDDVQAVAVGFVLFVVWSGAASVGGYLRYQQERRQEAIASVRRAERLDIARELHDLVAHHITGIVVQAQAARTVGARRPEAVLPALDAIATAGGDALTAMRRLVGVLRSEEDASRTPGTTLADLRTLVDNFSANGGPQVAFDIGQGVSDAPLPLEVLTTLHRVLQESLTNIRRHAPGTGWVEADVNLVPGGVRLRVRNYGSASDPRVTRLGGGFGLVGMAERVEALGGRLTAGFTPQGAWEVCAMLKCDTAPPRPDGP